jgi:hypothetical protein
MRGVRRETTQASSLSRLPKHPIIVKDPSAFWRTLGNRVCGPASVLLVCGRTTHPAPCVAHIGPLDQCVLLTQKTLLTCPDSADPPLDGGLTLFLGPGREGSTPRYGSDVASGFRLQKKLTHRRTRAFDPHARRRPHPGQHRLPPRSSGHDPRSRRGKHPDYRRGLDLWDKFV